MYLYLLCRCITRKSDTIAVRCCGRLWFSGVLTSHLWLKSNCVVEGFCLGECKMLCFNAFVRWGRGRSVVFPSAAYATRARAPRLVRFIRTWTSARSRRRTWKTWVWPPRPKISSCPSGSWTGAPEERTGVPSSRRISRQRLRSTRRRTNTKLSDTAHEKKREFWLNLWRESRERSYRDLTHQNCC